MSVWNRQYKVNRLPSGNILLKIITQEIHLDTSKKTTSIRLQLSSLDDYIGTIGCDITKITARVKFLLAGISAIGETSNDLLTNI